MKISNNINYKVNFGYDKKLNNELKKKLKDYPDREWADTLSALNKQCNDAEDKLVKAEKKHDRKKSRYADYLDILTYSKELLSGLVDLTFEKLKYSDREYTHYFDKFVKNGKKDDDWRKRVCIAMEAWTSPNIIDELEKKYGFTIWETSKSVAPEPEKKDKPKVHSGYDKPEPDNSSSSIPKLSKKSFLEELEIDTTVPKGFADVAGMHKLKKELTDGIVAFINNPEQAQADFEDYGKSIPKALLLYGPPGCGKTHITQALSTEIGTPVYLLNISKAGSKYINQTSQNIKEAFDEAALLASKSDKPCLLFMDEIDSMAFERTGGNSASPEEIKQIATLLQEIDKAKKSNIIIIGATNKYNLLDPAIRRRFDDKVFVDVPDFESRVELLNLNLKPLKKGQTLLQSQEDIEYIAGKLEGFSGSSICKISQNAALNALERNRADISVQDYDKAIKETTEEKPDRNVYLKDDDKSRSRIGFCPTKPD